MKRKLVHYLACPSCKGALECVISREDNTFSWNEILEGKLICEKCGLDYGIKRGVPRLVYGQLAKEVKHTIEGFGWEWQTFDGQIDRTYMTSKANFLDFIDPVTEDYFKNKVVLDAGCGMGRFLKLGAEFGSGEIIGVDLSDSVDVAYRRTRALANAHVVQADILSLPFTKKFDYIFAVGVLHHMQGPREGFCQLTKLLKEGGSISAWVYSRENNRWAICYLTPVRKYITSRLPRPALYMISHALSLPLYACIRLVYRNPGGTGIMSRIGRLLPYGEYLSYSSRLSYGSLASVIFDHLVPQLAAYISREEFELWFRSEDLYDVTISSRNGMSWRGRGTRGPSLDLGKSYSNELGSRGE